MKKQIGGMLSAGLLSLGMASTADAALVSSLGGKAYYDTVLDITWLQDANFAKTSGHDADGFMTWANANAWAAGLSINGVTGWRLPTVAPIDGASFNTVFSNNATTDWGYATTGPGGGWRDGSGTPVSEMGYMYYVNLANLGFCTPNNGDPGGCSEQAGWGLTNTGPFSNVQSSGYWSGTELVSIGAWLFSFRSGSQNGNVRLNSHFAWAVHSGNVSAIPIPGAVWLFGSGLIGLLGLARRKR